MNNTHINSNTQATQTSAGAFTVLKFAFGLSFLLGAGVLAPSQALAWHCTLAVSPTTIQSGATATISWTTINTTSFSIDNGVGSVTPIPAGSTTISPTSDTTYLGTALGPEGSITCSTSIKVTPPPPPPPTCTLTASATSINSGDSSKLSWTTTNATSFTIDNSVGSVTPVAAGTSSVSPTTTTTYTGTATGAGGTVTCTAKVAVTTPPPPPTCHNYSKSDKITGSVTAGIATLTVPSDVCSVKVSFSSYNLPDGKVNPFSHQVLFDNITDTYGPGTHSVGPLKLACSWQTDLYLGDVQTVIGTSGTVGLIAYDDLTDQTCGTPPPPPTCTLTASATSINSGDSSKLSWTTANATSLSIDNSLGSETPVNSGSASVSPTSNTTYKATATGAGGTVTCTATVTVVPPPLACTLSANPTSINSGDSSTLSWTTTSATSFSIDNHIGTVTPVAAGSTSTAPTTTTTYTALATGTSGTVTCHATVTIPPPVNTGCTSNCGGGGGGGGPSTPNVVLSVLPHVGNQPLAYLYLSQIPYTGLDLGPVGTVLYWAALIAWALALAYLVLFWLAPLVNRFFRNLGARVKEALNTPEPVYAGVPQQRMLVARSVKSVAAPAPVIQAQEPQETPRGYSSYDGFKSFAHNGSLSIDDIVKGLARTHAAPVAVAAAVPEVAPAASHYVEPIHENVEPITDDSTPEVASAAAPIHIRGFVAALVQGDRSAVFAGLRQYTRGGGAPEKLISETACLLDDAYRARLDGTSADADITRLVARLDTPTLEKLVASLTTAIDSSYTAGVTGAKIALTRALATLGAQ